MEPAATLCCQNSTQNGQPKIRLKDDPFFITLSIICMWHTVFEDYHYIHRNKKRKNLSYGNKQKSHLIMFILVWNFESIHGSDHGLHCCKYILVHQFRKASFVFIRITWSMNDSHLLDKRAFATLSCTCKRSKKDIL